MRRLATYPLTPTDRPIPQPRPSVGIGIFGNDHCACRMRCCHRSVSRDGATEKPIAPPPIPRAVVDVTNTIVFSARVGVQLTGAANILNGVHTWNCATGNGGTGEASGRN